MSKLEYKGINIVSYCQSTTPRGGDKGDNVRVVVRCRPMNDKEKSAGHEMAVHGNYFMSEFFL